MTKITNKQQKSGREHKSNLSYLFSLFIILFSFFVSSCNFFGTIGGSIESRRPQTPELETYTVMFIANGGTPAPEEQTVTHGDKADGPEAITRTGYTFDGWYTEAAFNNRWDFTTDTVTADTTLYAKWNAITYTVIFHSNGGTGTMPEQSFTYDATQNLRANTFTRTGFNFSGWALTADGAVEFENGESVNNLTAIAGDIITLFARWGGHSYYITYNANGGSGVMENSSLFYGVSYHLKPNAFTRTGYTFAGWSETAGGAVRYSDGESVIDLTSVAGATITLHAVWNPILYTVVYDKNAVDVTGNMGNSTHTYGVERNLNANQYTRAGWTFGGWARTETGTAEYTDGQSVINLTSVAGDTVNLFAQWNRIIYTVTFNSNGGSAVEPQQVPAGDRAVRPLDPTRGGSWIFDDWYTNDNFNVLFDFNTLITAPITVFARWVAARVTFDKNGGDTEAEPRSLTVTPPATSLGSLPVPPIRSGWIFIGWNTEVDGSGTPFNATTTVTGNITVYAQWLHTVTFNSNGGTAVPDQTVSHGGTATRPSNPALSGHVFDYWYTNEGFTVPYSFNTAVTVNITLYARWVSQAEINAMAGKDMVFVPGGSFDLGREIGTAGSGDEINWHQVTLTGFYMGRYQVTRAQFQAVMTGNNNGIDANPPYLSTVAFNTEELAAGGGNMNLRPAHVSWYDAMVFCNRLSMQEGLTPAYRINGSTDPSDWGTVPLSPNATWDAVETVSGSAGYRLPTEAQWEYASKGGYNPPAGFTYSGSDNPLTVAWHDANSGNFPQMSPRMVGILAPNALGIYDMSGNVSEWCWDRYSNYTSGAKTDPTGASSGSLRMSRGGSWYYAAASTRSVYRHYSDPSTLGYYHGFRLVAP